MPGLGIITGLASETRCLRGISDAGGIRVGCAGADSTRAGVLARDLAAESCAALVSFGMAGGLDPALRPGDVIIASGVAAAGEAIATDAEWAASVRRALSGTLRVADGTMADAAALVSTAEAKRTLYAASGAAAVDMESLAVGAAAAERGARFLIVRAIADTADQGIPVWMAGVVDTEGRSRPLRFLRGIAARPGDAITAMRLVGASGRALDSLSRVAALLGPGFGLAELGG